MHEQGTINLLNHGQDVWFTHSAAAARQFVDVMRGDVVIPRELRRAALETDFDWGEDMALGLPAVDVVAVEVSSLKTHSVGTIILNAHKVYGIAKETGLDPTPIAQGATASLPEQHPLKEMKVAYASHSQLVEDLLAIRDATSAPVITVDHLYSLTPEGVPAPERVRLTEELRTVEAEHGIVLHSTRKLIMKHGFDAALEDHNHYRPEFESLAGEDLAATIRLVCARKKVQSI